MKKPTRCTRCPEGTMIEGTITQTLEREETVLVIRGVPAYVCDLCGESLLAGEVVEQLHSTFERAYQRGVQFDVRRYVPERDDQAPEETTSEAP